MLSFPVMEKVLTPHGEIETPAFMPIATRGAIRTAPFSVLNDLNAQIILSNTFHLILRPGLEVVSKAGGLHSFLGWDKPILTDSGGFQVYSLSKNRTITDEGVKFNSPLDGSEVFLTPESVIEAQQIFCSDISMILDEVCALPASEESLRVAVERTTRWAKRAKTKFMELTAQKNPKPLLFGIVQGGLVPELRKKSLEELMEIGFDGYAIGGLSVGETHEQMLKILDFLLPLMPKDKPRYLMGVGQPEDIVEAVKRSVDMFDCVLPTRNARHALLYMDLNEEYLKEILSSSESVKPEKLYQKVNIRNNEFAENFEIINPNLKTLKKTSYAYLRHLFQSGEHLAQVLATSNNLWFYLNLMEKIRNII